MPDAHLLVVIAIIALALLFDYSNGFHDAANSIAMVVSTRVLSPRIAVMWAAFFNFIAFLVFKTAVADTVGKTVSSHIVSDAVVFAGLVGAVVWNFTTWYFALPTSSSHALIGGFAGAGVAKGGLAVLNAASLKKTISFIVLSPMIGLALGFLLMVVFMWTFRRFTPRRVDKLFRRLQLLSAAALSLGHGANDAQKTMGVISALLVGAGYLHVGADGKLPIPLWVVLLAEAAIALGTLTGGWRIVRTLAQKITVLKPVGATSAQMAASTALFVATHFGIPVSTTHTITGAIVGAGSSKRLSAVRWGIAGRIVWAWVITIPAAGLVAALAYGITALPSHLLSAAVFVVIAAVAAAAYWMRVVRKPSSTPAPVSA